MKFLVLIGFLFINASNVRASVVRFSKLESFDSLELMEVLKGKSNHTLEFKKGDLIPLSLEVKGSLLSFKKSSSNFLNVERDFYIKVHNSSFEISFDGHDFFPAPQALTGSLSIGAGTKTNGTSIVNMLNILLELDRK